MRRGLKGGKLRLLSKDEVYDIHLSVLRVLEEHGVKIEHEGALKLLDDAGAIVDYKNKVARIPDFLVEETIKKAPRSFRLCGRDPKQDFIVENRRVYFGPCAGATNIIDVRTGKRKIGTLADMADVAKVSDALPNIDFVMGLTSASDVSHITRPLYEPFIVLCNTSKHVQAFCYEDGELTKALIKIAALAVGGVEELEKRPIISLYDEPSSPLIFGGEYVEALIEWAKHGLPMIWAPCPICGCTAPVTLAGAIVQGVAESLGGNVLCQLVHPGTPFVFGSVPLVFDMRSVLAAYGTVEMMIKQVMLAQLSDFYGIPSWGTGGCSDSKTLDMQAAIEASMSLTISALSGNNLVHDVAFLEYANSGSIELLVICDEVIEMIRRILEGVRIDQETLAVEAIKEAGHAGSFLSLKHTLKHFTEEHIIYELMDRSSWERWHSLGEKTLIQRAREKALKILKEHEVKPPIPKDIKEEMEKIIKDVEKKKSAEKKA